MTYQEIKSKHPVLFECFFAFSNQQFAEGVKKAGLEEKKIFRGQAGLFGTKEGIEKLYADYKLIEKGVAKSCTPQEVYDDEYINHECGYVGDDEEAIQIVVGYFGKEKAKEVNRSFAYTKI